MDLTEETKLSDELYPEIKKFIPIPSDKDDPLVEFWPNHHLVHHINETSHLIGNQQPFINPISGSGAVMHTCKHYSHAKCLIKYFE